MAITQGAKKAIRQNARKRVFNTRRIRRTRDVIKDIEKLLEAGKADDAQAKLPQAYQALDKAAKMGTLKKNTVSRKKSRLAARIKKVKAGK